MPPTQTTSSCACKAFLRPAIFQETPCSRRVTAETDFPPETPRARWLSAPFVFGGNTRSNRGAARAAGIPCMTCIDTAQYKKSVIQPGDVKHAVQTRALKN